MPQYKRSVLQPFLKYDMHQAQRQCGVRAGFDTDILIGLGCRHRVARIYDHQTGTRALASMIGRIRFRGWDSPGLVPQTTIMSASGVPDQSWPNSKP